jgi:4-diphosphocytidyl-2-C-methyl-D-erythritol kinase
MYLHRGNFTWTALAPAKLNLFLEVFGRRADGFHELETLMVPIRLADSLRFTVVPRSTDGRPGPINFTLHDNVPLRPPRHHQPFPADRNNLVVRALELFRERSGCDMGAEIEVVKRIPAAAGLGGGSSDAATALRLANRAWGLDWPVERLMEMAADLGSDVPFFHLRRAAICRGRGERVQPLKRLRTMHFVIVKPPADLSTTDVYRAHDALVGTNDSCPAWQAKGNALMAGSGDTYAWMLNRLQSAAASLSPWIERLHGAFARLGFLRHQLTGSGTAYFGVCRNAAHAHRLASILRARQLGLVYATRSYG